MTNITGDVRNRDDIPVVNKLLTDGGDYTHSHVLQSQIYKYTNIQIYKFTIQDSTTYKPTSLALVCVFPSPNSPASCSFQFPLPASRQVSFRLVAPTVDQRHPSKTHSTKLTFLTAAVPATYHTHSTVSAKKKVDCFFLYGFVSYIRTYIYPRNLLSLVKFMLLCMYLYSVPTYVTIT